MDHYFCRSCYNTMDPPKKITRNNHELAEIMTVNALDGPANKPVLMEAFAGITSSDIEKAWGETHEFARRHWVEAIAEKKANLEKSREESEEMLRINKANREMWKLHDKEVDEEERYETALRVAEWKKKGKGDDLWLPAPPKKPERTGLKFKIHPDKITKFYTSELGIINKEYGINGCFFTEELFEVQVRYPTFKQHSYRTKVSQTLDTIKITWHPLVKYVGKITYQYNLDEGFIDTDKSILRKVSDSGWVTVRIPKISGRFPLKKRVRVEFVK